LSLYPRLSTVFRVAGGAGAAIPLEARFAALRMIAFLVETFEKPFPNEDASRGASVVSGAVRVASFT
jgi:hypothetical protein